VTPRVLVAGLGNVLMTDDAIGPYCTELLLADCEFPDNVEVSDLGAPGLDLTLHLSSADIVIAIDALRGVEPGTVRVFDRTALLIGYHATRLDTHAPALEESILIAQLTSGRPLDVTLIGLGGASFEYGTTLSPVVRQTMGALVDRVLAELTTLGVAWRRREHSATPHVWWAESADLSEVESPRNPPML
jgi:hydrogenase maturation protease